VRHEKGTMNWLYSTRAKKLKTAEKNKQTMINLCSTTMQAAKGK